MAVLGFTAAALPPFVIARPRQRPKQSPPMGARTFERRPVCLQAKHHVPT